MTPSRPAIEELADDVVRQDVAAQAGLPGWRKADLPIGAGATWSPPAAVPQATNWTFIVLVLLAIVALGGIATTFVLLSGQPPQATTGVVGSATPTQPPAISPTPTASATSTATQTSTVPPASQPADLSLVALQEQLDTLFGGAAPDLLDALRRDAAGDTYLPHNGSPATANQPYIDLIGTGAVAHQLSQTEATALSSFACGSQSAHGELTIFTACNQPGPLPAGDYVFLAAYYQAAPPVPFPAVAQCVYILQLDIDADRTTGFQSPLAFNHLIGADVYLENLFFFGADGAFQNYILGTDHALPPRADTGEVHGNLPLMGRWFASQHDPGAGAAWVQTAWIPAEMVAADAFSMGGFCDADRTTPRVEDFSVDALGMPASEPFPVYLEFDR